MLENANIVLLCAVVANLSAIVALLQLNIYLLLFLDQKRRQNEQLAISALLDANRCMQRIYATRRRVAAPRRHWINPGRTSTWWDNLINGETLGEEWKKNLRMTKEDFLHLVDQLRIDIQPDENAIRDSLPPEKKVAITLYYLKDQGSYLMTCNAFGVGKSTLSSVIKDVCRAINRRVGPNYLKLPTTNEEMSNLIEAFHKKFGLPQVFGCVDGTHIPIRQPTENPQDYFCYKMKYSLNCQAVCDHKGRFLNVEIKWPGSVHDARVFSNSDINCMFQKKLIPMMLKELLPGEDEVPPVILADPAYPLLPNVMKEHACCTKNEEVIFNEMLRSARNQIECAFGRLKARWRILTRPMDIKLDDLPTVIYACFVLHNYCEIKSNNNCMNDDIIQNQIQLEQNMQNCHHHSVADQLYSYNSAHGTYVRNIITSYLKEYM